MPQNAPAPGSTAARTREPRSAAEHCAAAEALFARARAMHAKLSSGGAEPDEYTRCLEWARLHLRFAEAITAGAALNATQLRLKADGLRMLNFHASSEAYSWNEFLAEVHGKTRGSE